MNVMGGGEGWVPPSSSSSVQLLMICASLLITHNVSIGKVLVLTYSMRHGDHLSAFSYRNWENLLMCGLFHPGGGLCHYLGQLLGLMQVKPLLRLLMMTEEQDGQAQAEDDTIFNIWGIHHHHIFYDSDCP